MEENYLVQQIKDKNFVIVPNKLARDKHLSLSARGLLCYMLSCKEDWKFTIRGLSTATGETPYKIQKALGELEGAGYHRKESVREEGKIVSWKYYIADYPAFIGQESEEKPKEKTTFEKCADVINKEFVDPDVKSKLFDFLTMRIKLGRLTEERFTEVVLELRNLAHTKEEAEEIIKTATLNQWRKFYPVRKRRTFVDDLKAPVITDDSGGLLKQMYLEEFADIPKCDRPAFQEWAKGKQ